jgi:hypothetical protein
MNILAVPAELAQHEWQRLTSAEGGKESAVFTASTGRPGQLAPPPQQPIPNSAVVAQPAAIPVPHPATQLPGYWPVPCSKHTVTQERQTHFNTGSASPALPAVQLAAWQLALPLAPRDTQCCCAAQTRPRESGSNAADLPLPAVAQPLGQGSRKCNMY